MSCDVVNLGGISAILCSRGRRRPLCVACLAGGVKREAPLLCDWPLETGSNLEPPRTCSRPMCRAHRHGPAGVDYCRDHTGTPE